MAEYTCRRLGGGCAGTSEERGKGSRSGPFGDPGIGRKAEVEDDAGQRRRWPAEHGDQDQLTRRVANKPFDRL